jgi:hypothetical protein
MTPFLHSVYEYENVLMSHMGSGGRTSLQYALIKESAKGFAVCVYASGGTPLSNLEERVTNKILYGFSYHDTYETCVKEYFDRVQLPEVPL